MHRWESHDVGRRGDLLADWLPFTVTEKPRPFGLLITCAEHCLAPDALAGQLRPDAWICLRTAGGFIPPVGSGANVEESQIEHAVAERAIRHLVICGHVRCEYVAQLRETEPHDTDEFVDSWSSHADRVRRAMQTQGSCDARTAAEICALAQIGNALTHPVVAAAHAQNRLQLWTWLYDDAADELYSPAAGSSRFSQLVALHPAQNLGIRPEVIRRRRPENAPPPSDGPQIWLA